MSEQPSISKQNELNPRTARAVAAILSQTSTDETLRGLNNSDGRNQSEQASFLAAESPFLREIYERGGTIVDGVLTVPRENLTTPPEIEIATQYAAVERLTAITGDNAKAKELATQLVEMGERIAGSESDGETRLKVFGWLYRTLEGKQDLLQPQSAEKDAQNLPIHSETEFAERWQQIVELSEAMAALEPKDRLPEKSLDEAVEKQSRPEHGENHLYGQLRPRQQRGNRHVFVFHRRAFIHFERRSCLQAAARSGLRISQPGFDGLDAVGGRHGFGNLWFGRWRGD